MTRSRTPRGRPSTPDSIMATTETQEEQHLTADPTSPPETPTTSPPISRKHSLKPRRQPDFRDLFKAHRPLNEDPHIKPFGNGHQFSYQPTLGPEQLSPRSSSSSSSGADNSSDIDASESASIGSVHDASALGVAPEVDEDESDDAMSDSDSSDDSDASEAEDEAEEAVEVSHITMTTTTVVCNFVLEDVDPMDSDCEGLDILQPTEIESNRSRSRSKREEEPPKELDKDMMHDLKNLNCSNETSETDDSPDFDEEAFLRRREQLRKFRRMSMGSSFGKRTHSELSDSDDDCEALDVNEVGASARRMRRKMQRTSLLFHDPPPARIDELEEPDSSEDERAPPVNDHLARELPYWAMEIMEMDSS